MSEEERDIRNVVEEDVTEENSGEERKRKDGRWLRRKEELKNNKEQTGKWGLRAGRLCDSTGA